MPETKTSPPVCKQISEALDGRTQRWLSFRTMIAESDLSKKMNGKAEFTQDEINKIEEVLSCKITTD